MEEKYNNLLKRTATIIIVVPLVFLTIFWKGFPFFIVIIIVALLGLRELYSIARKQGYKPLYILGAILTSYFILISVYHIYSLTYYIEHIVITFFITLLFIIKDRKG